MIMDYDFCLTLFLHYNSMRVKKEWATEEAKKIILYLEDLYQNKAAELMPWQQISEVLKII